MAGLFRGIGAVIDATVEASSALQNTAIAANAASRGLISMAASFTSRQQEQDKKDCEAVSQDCLQSYNDLMTELKLRMR